MRLTREEREDYNSNLENSNRGDVRRDMCQGERSRHPLGGLEIVLEVGMERIRERIDAWEQGHASLAEAGSAIRAAFLKGRFPDEIRAEARAVTKATTTSRNRVRSCMNYCADHCCHRGQ